MEARREVGADHDITASLMHDVVRGRPLNHEEVASILRNWTAGEIGTISAAAGILVHFLAEHPDLHARLRKERQLLPEAIDEILRIHGPLVLSRRVTTRDVVIGGRSLAAGQRISLNWISANRDEAVFEDPEEFRFGRDASKNLLYGIGIHICPGAPLARLELLVFLETLFDLTSGWEQVGDAVPAFYPASGFVTLPMRLLV
jgi:cytochrome P450